MTDRNLNSLNVKELTDLYNTVARAAGEETVKSFKSKADALKAIRSATFATPAAIAKVTKSDAYTVRQQLRAAQEAGTLKHQRHKHYALSVADVFRVFLAPAA